MYEQEDMLVLLRKLKQLLREGHTTRAKECIDVHIKILELAIQAKE